MTAAFTVHLDDDVAEQSWQIAQIQEGLDAANAGDFASEDEVNAVFAKSGLAPISWK